MQLRDSNDELSQEKVFEIKHVVYVSSGFGVHADKEIHSRWFLGVKL